MLMGAHNKRKDSRLQQKPVDDYQVGPLRKEADHKIEDNKMGTVNGVKFFDPRLTNIEASMPSQGQPTFDVHVLLNRMSAA